MFSVADIDRMIGVRLWAVATAAMVAVLALPSTAVAVTVSEPENVTGLTVMNNHSLNGVNVSMWRRPLRPSALNAGGAWVYYYMVTGLPKKANCVVETQYDKDATGSYRTLMPCSELSKPKVYNWASINGVVVDKSKPGARVKVLSNGRMYSTFTYRLPRNEPTVTVNPAVCKIANVTVRDPKDFVLRVDTNGRCSNGWWHVVHYMDGQMVFVDDNPTVRTVSDTRVVLSSGPGGFISGADEVEVVFQPNAWRAVTSRAVPVS